MMTSRSEYRLLLRQDNADQRLTPKGYEVGLISEERYRRFLKKMEQIDAEMKRVEQIQIGAGAQVQEFLTAHQSTPLQTGASMCELIRRPELTYQMLSSIDPDRPDLPADVADQVNIRIKYDGYIRRQLSQVQQFKRMESRLIPETLDYGQVPSLRTEARQKLTSIRPVSIGQASRISGVSPADISVLLVYLEAHK